MFVIFFFFLYLAPHKYACLYVGIFISGTNNTGINCDSSKWYIPPLPYDITINGVYYSQLTQSDIDCSESEWSDSPCTSSYCNRYNDGIQQAAAIMSIPYIMSALFSPVVGRCSTLHYATLAYSAVPYTTLH